MLKSLLVGTNGSQWSDMAVELGLDWARTYGAQMTFIGIIDVPAIIGREPMPIGGSAWKEERDERLIAEARTRVNEAVERATARAAEFGVQSRPLVVEGEAVEELGNEIQRHDALVVGKRAVPKSDHEPAPSDTLSDILHRAPRPVAVAGGPGVAPDAPVLIAYDGSRQAARAVASFVASGLYEKRRHHVIGVADDDAEVIAANVSRAVEFLEKHGRSVHSQVLPEGRGVPETLLDQVTRLSAGLMVMGVYGEGRVRELLFGSATRRILTRAEVPLFLDR